MSVTSAAAQSCVQGCATAANARWGSSYPAALALLWPSKLTDSGILKSAKGPAPVYTDTPTLSAGGVVPGDGPSFEDVITWTSGGTLVVEFTATVASADLVGDVQVFGPLYAASTGLKAKDGTNTASVATSWAVGDVVTAVVSVDSLGRMCINDASIVTRNDATALAIEQSTVMTIKRISATSYLLLKQVGAENLYQGLLLGNATCYIDDIAIYTKAVSTRSAAGNRVGTFTYMNPTAAAYGGSYYQTTVTGAYCEFTLSGSLIGWRSVRTTVGGFALVSIDGDNTAANLLPTAQYLVDRGIMAASCLVAGGGTLNPTDRILDQYWKTTQADWTTALAAGLENTSHTVRVTCTGYKRPASSNVRLNVNAWFTQDADGGLLPCASFTGEFASAFELASSVTPTGYSSQLVGTVHGGETIISVTPYLGGAAATIDDGETITGDVYLRRVSTLAHTAAGVDVATVTVDYADGGNGFSVGVSLDWLVGGTSATYRGMMPAKEYLDIFSARNIPYDITSRAQDYSYSDLGRSGVFYGAAHDGYLIVESTARGYIEDRGDGSFFNKIYLSGSDASVIYTESINDGDITEFSVKYSCKMTPMESKPIASTFSSTMPTLALSPSAPGDLRSVQCWSKVATVQEIDKMANGIHILLKI